MSTSCCYGEADVDVEDRGTLMVELELGCWCRSYRVAVAVFLC